jgi:ABC-type multidrug transport system ATPase subunit/pSer/pThr/pTyr-binding forkhead associated (FHA) protein
MQCRFCGASGADISMVTGGPTTCLKCGRVLSGPPLIPGRQQSTPEEGTAPFSGLPMHARFLVAQSGPLEGKRVPIFSSGLRVGRHPAQNDLVLEDGETSRQHARLSVDGQGCVVIENNSVNGTYVNDLRIDMTVLQPGDHIRFGLSASTLFVYESLARRDGTAPQTSAQAPAAAMSATPAQPVIKQADASASGTRHSNQTVQLRDGEESPPPDARLQLVLDQYAVQDIPLTAPLIEIGSVAGPGRIRIQHPSVAAQHADLTFTKEGFALLRDRGTQSGTFVNGERIKERILAEGDLIRLGTCDSRLLLYREARRRPMVLKDIELNRPVVTLGRAPDNNVPLNHPTVSQYHAEIHKHGATFELVDKDSTNGTFVNGARAKKQVLRARDRISLGAIQLIFDGNVIAHQSDGTHVRLYAYELRRSIPDPTRLLLDRISLAIEPREFVGLLGPSGAGKTTLMHALNGSQPADAGAVLLNSWNLYADYAALRATMGYLPQEDVLHRTLTVKQCLYYSAKLRLPDDHGEKEIWTRVNEVINVLDLEERADLVIDRLSGGQRKRVSLGIELLSKPSLLFMDEPTAGQDPRTEMKMMQLFREIANRGATVVATTHLLGSFSLLDKVGVLVEGRLAYFGPSQDMLAYFRTTHPAEVFDRLREKPAEVWAKEYRTSSIFKEYVVKPLGDQTKEPDGPAAGKMADAMPAERKPSLRQLQTLISRQLTLRLTDWANVAGMLAPPAAIAFLVGLMKETPNDPKLLFMVVFSALWFGCSASVREIVDEQLIYKRERERNLPIPYYLGSKLVYLAALALVQSVLFISVMTMMGAQENHFFGAIGIMWLLTLEGALIGLVISALASNPEKALYIFPLALIPQLLLAGLFIPVQKPEKVYLFPEVEGRQVSPLADDKNLPKGMQPLLHYVASPVMVGRWGLEALSDLYVHDYKKYSYLILDGVTISLHGGEFRRADRHLNALGNGSSSIGRDADTALPAYVAMLSLFAAVMIGTTGLAMKMKDRR